MKGARGGERPKRSVRFNEILTEEKELKGNVGRHGGSINDFKNRKQ